MASLAAPSKNLKMASLQELCLREYLDGILSPEAKDELRKPIESIIPRFLVEWEQASREIIPQIDQNVDSFQKISEIYKSVMYQANHPKIKPYLICSLSFICEKIRDKNLILFFNEISKQTLPNLDGDITKQAANIRDWIKSNPSVFELRKLELDRSQLSTLPPGFNPPNLELMSIVKTPLNAFPPEFNPSPLKVIHIDGTLLQALPDSFNPPLLERLYILNSPLRTLPEGFNPPNLTLIDLTHTPLGAEWKKNGIPERFRRNNLTISL